MVAIILPLRRNVLCFSQKRLKEYEHSRRTFSTQSIKIEFRADDEEFSKFPPVQNPPKNVWMNRWLPANKTKEKKLNRPTRKKMTVAVKVFLLSE